MAGGGTSSPAGVGGGGGSSRESGSRVSSSEVLRGSRWAQTDVFRGSNIIHHSWFVSETLITGEARPGRGPQTSTPLVMGSCLLSGTGTNPSLIVSDLWCSPRFLQDPWSHLGRVCRRILDSINQLFLLPDSSSSGALQVPWSRFGRRSGTPSVTREDEPQTSVERVQRPLSLISLWFPTQNVMSLYSALQDLKLDVPSNF